MNTTNTNPLLGLNRSAILAAAVKAIGHGARVIDDGCPLTMLSDRTVSVGVSVPRKARAIYKSLARSTVALVSVNVDTLVSRIEE